MRQRDELELLNSRIVVVLGAILVAVGISFVVLGRAG